MSRSQFLLQCHNVNKSYQEGDINTPVLKDVNLQIQHHEMAAIVGSSGSGKSTLLHILGGLDRPDNGSVLLNDSDIFSLPSHKLAKLRNEHLGFVYQFHHLMTDFNALENVMLPLLIAGISKNEAEQRAAAMLNAVSLSKRIKHRPSALSGGERQRVAIARALVNKPSLVLADEPTGNLDHKTTKSIFELISQLNQEQGIGFLLVTHDMSLADKLSRRFVMQDGVLTELES